MVADCGSRSGACVSSQQEARPSVVCGFFDSDCVSIAGWQQETVAATSLSATASATGAAGIGMPVIAQTNDGKAGTAPKPASSTRVKNRAVARRVNIRVYYAASPGEVPAASSLPIMKDETWHFVRESADSSDILYRFKLRNGHP